MASSTPPSPTRDTIVISGGKPDDQSRLKAVEGLDTSESKVEMDEGFEAVSEVSKNALPATTDTAPTFHANDIHDHYWKPQVTDNANDLPSTFASRSHHGTINSSASDPNSLKYILLFRDANPRWESDGIIFVKSSIRILPDGERFKDDPQPEVKKKRGFWGPNKSKKWSKGGRQERKWDKPKNPAFNRKGAKTGVVDGASQDAQTQKSLMKDEVVDATNLAVKDHDVSDNKSANGEQEKVAASVDSTEPAIMMPLADGENKPTTEEQNAVNEVGSTSGHGEPAKPVDIMKSDTDVLLEKDNQETDSKKTQATTELDKDNGTEASQEASQINAQPPGHDSRDTSTHQIQDAGEKDEVWGSSEPPYTPDMSLFNTGPIAIFEQSGKSQHGGFRFTGYYKITRLQYLAPHTRELSRMLEQKFSTVDRFGRVTQRSRTPESWEASSSQRWAVVKMEMDEEACTDLSPPDVKVREWKGKEVQDREAKDKEAKDKEAKDKEAKDKEAKDSETKDSEAKDREAKESVGAALEQGANCPLVMEESKD